MNRLLLEHALTVLRDTRGIAETMVVSRDPEALAIAREFEARTLLEQGGSSLNSALERAAAVARAYQLRGLLILPADLPLLEVEDLNAILEAAGPAPAVVVAPDRRETGTNALLVLPPGRFRYKFGRNSFNAHCLTAQEMGAHLSIVRRRGLGLDLDLPEDLALLRDIEGPHVEQIGNLSLPFTMTSSQEGTK
jgi:2-phospho-L-lactate guanylyltransferase